MAHDLFISHASEDKDAVARPLARALTERGLLVWYDEFSLAVGDSLTEAIDRGLADSSFGAVIISPSFISKPWPKRELRGLSAKALSATNTVLLPIWHNISHAQVLAFSPPLADVLALSTKDGIDQIAERLCDVIRPDLTATTIIRSRGLLQSGEIGAAIVVAASLLERQLKKHAIDRLTYKFFSKKPIRAYGLGQLVRVLRSKGYLPRGQYGQEPDFDSIVRIRNLAAHQPNEVSFADAEVFLKQVESALNALQAKA